MNNGYYKNHDIRFSPSVILMANRVSPFLGKAFKTESLLLKQSFKIPFFINFQQPKDVDQQKCRVVVEK